MDYDEWDDTYTPDDGVALHHGGGSDYRAGRQPYSVEAEKAQLRAWEAYHIDHNGWRGLAYGWGIGQTGTIYRIRGWNSYGAHTGDRDGDGISNNSEIVPIIFIGSGNHHDLSTAAKVALVELRRYIESQAPKAKVLYGHQELKGTATSCPGPKLMTYVQANRTLPEEEMATFKDVPADHPFYNAIEWLADTGITQGIKKDDPNTPANEGLYGPDLPVTRGQLAVFLKRYYDRFD